MTHFTLYFSLANSSQFIIMPKSSGHHMVTQLIILISIVNSWHPWMRTVAVHRRSRATLTRLLALDAHHAAISTAMPADQLAMRGNAVRIVYTDITRFLNPFVHCAVRILGAAGSGLTRIQGGVKSAAQSGHFVTVLGNVWMQMDARHAVQSKNIDLIDRRWYMFDMNPSSSCCWRENIFGMLYSYVKYIIENNSDIVQHSNYICIRSSKLLPNKINNFNIELLIH